MSQASFFLRPGAVPAPTILARGLTRRKDPGIAFFDFCADS